MVTWIYYGSNWRLKENAPLELKTKMSILPSRQGLSNIVCLLWLWWMFEDLFSWIRMRGSLQCLAQISDVNFRLMSNISDDTMSRVYGYVKVPQNEGKEWLLHRFPHKRHCVYLHYELIYEFLNIYSVHSDIPLVTHSIQSNTAE